ncbi:transporter [Bacteroidia bacterium]|nr:transporter [Bacteroidia bacterium]
MWNKFIRHLLTNRIWYLVITGVITIFMAIMAMHVRMSFSMPQMLPNDNETFVQYQTYLKQFGADGNVAFSGVCDERLFEVQNFRAWNKLTQDIKEVDGVTLVLSFSNAFQLKKDEPTHQFTIQDIFPKTDINQYELDSLMNIFFNLPFYDGFLFNSDTRSCLMMIFFDKNKINTNARDHIVHDIQHLLDRFSQKTQIETHVSGLPYIRTVTSQKIKSELFLFSFLALLVAMFSLMAFFKSFKATILPMIVVVINVIWTLGLFTILGFEISILASMLPPLLIIIGIENSIFLINKYHHEFRKHGNKILALSRAITRIGRANFLTNLTTSIGFLAFVITPNQMLVEFGIIATIAIMCSYLLTLTILPILFSFTPAPSVKQVSHLDNRLIEHLLSWIEDKITFHTKTIFYIVGGAVIVGVIGAMLLYTSGRVVDDIPHRDKMYQDMLFFEEHYDGIIPMEITIDAKQPKGLMTIASLSKIDAFQDKLSTFAEFARPLSFIEVLKFMRQAYYNGNPDFYAMPTQNEMVFISDYMPEGMLRSTDTTNTLTGQIMQIFVDSSFQHARMSVQMQNLSTPEISDLHEELKEIVDEIFDSHYEVAITGSSMIFLEGTTYMIHNLIQSLLLALVLITFILFFMFRSWRMVLLAIISNLLPLLLTVTVMGYFGIPLKTSTILVFSVALGISVDNTIHFLSRYRLELRINNYDVRQAVMYALGEAGYSMLYSTVILFLGFLIFAFSSFGGTQMVGILVSFTLIVSLLSDLLFLPSLLLKFAK